MKIKLIAIIGSAMIGIGVGLWLISRVAIPAQVADEILRPILGEKKTIELEAQYFAVGEKLKQVRYGYLKLTDSPLEDNGDAGANNKNVDNMSLDQIKMNNGFAPISGEGQWQPMEVKAFPNQMVMAKTFVRPDQGKSYATVSLVKMDMKRLKIGVEAGTKYPGGTQGIPGPGVVPKEIQGSGDLVAVFNGGFQYKDGQYGMVVNHKTYVPIRSGLGTLLIDKDGVASMIDYQGGPIDDSAVSIRQNGPLLIKDGQITDFVEKGVDTWGRTTTRTMYTWRSGLGIDKDGNLIYAVGGSLLPETLGKALQAAGAVQAIQLDINPNWVRYIVYNTDSNGGYLYHPLLKNMVNGGYNYLFGYNKDFFFVYKK